jgi:ABC-2 type transport system permease protein
MDVYLVLLRASIQSQLAYRRSFLLEVFGRFWVTGFEVVALFVLVDHVGTLGGFDRAELLYLYGVASLALGVAELLTDGLNDMPELVRLGTFDALLVRPVPALVQVLGRQFRLMHVGRALQGALALSWALWMLPWDPGGLELAMLVINLASAFLVYVAVFVAEAATTIFTVQSRELFNAFTYGGVELTRYPVSIYDGWLRGIFLWIVPVGFVSYFPALVVLDHPDPLGMPGFLPYAAPLVAGAFFGLSVRYWQFAVDRYRSTGS